MPIPKSSLSKLAAFSAREGLLAPGDRVLAAVSGGADSVCLAHWLAGRAAKGRLKGVEVVHFNHGLRGKAAERDAAFVGAFARRLGLKCRVELLPTTVVAKREQRSLEDAGRMLRYKALSRLANAGGFTKVAVGHHLDDNAETVLLHLLRGTRAKGLCGIPPERPLAGCKAKLVRPLMALTRAEVQAYCRANRLQWREDATNRDEDFTRNWVRRRLIPFMESKSPRLKEHIARISEGVRRGSSGQVVGRIIDRGML